MITIQEYAQEVQKQDKLQQEYFAKKRKGIQDFALLKESKDQEALVRKLTDSILNPPESQLF